MHPTQTNVSPLPVLSIRVDETNPDHHLWCNHGVWWIHYVVHEGNRKRRVRRSMNTRDVAIARQRRDAEFERVAAAALELAQRTVQANARSIAWDACA